MKRIKLVSILIVFLILFCSFDCFAQEKTNGVKQSWRNFLNNRKTKKNNPENVMNKQKSPVKKELTKEEPAGVDNDEGPSVSMAKGKEEPAGYDKSEGPSVSMAKGKEETAGVDNDEGPSVSISKGKEETAGVDNDEGPSVSMAKGKEEILQRINANILRYKGDLLSRVPSLKVKMNAEGNEEYFGTVNSVLVKLEEMDREDLKKLYSQLSQAVSLLNAQRINSQVQSVNRVNRLSSSSRRNTVPPRSPKTYQPPRIQQAYVPKIPKVPSVPKNRY